MINGFEEHTEELTGDDIKHAHLVALILQGRIGVENALKNEELSDMLYHQLMVQISPAKMRKLINHIRRRQLVKNLIANSRGYYIAKNKEEIENYVKSLFQRMDAIKEVADSFDYRPEQIQIWNS